MSATVNVLCYRSKILSNGEHPLMICVTKDGKRKYQSLKVSIQPQFWDFKKNKPKRNCPNKEFIQKLINDKIEEYTQQILEFRSESKEFTVTKLVEKVSNPTIKSTVGVFLDLEIERLNAERRYGYEKNISSSKTISFRI